MMFVAAILYACVYWAIGWKWPKIPLMLIFALAPFQNDISGTLAMEPERPDQQVGGGPHFSIAEINLLLALPLFFMRRRPMLFGPIFVPTLLYLGAGLISALNNWRPSSTVSLIQMGMYLVISVMIFTSLTKNAEDFRLALVALVGVGSVLASAVLITRSGYVLNLHKNGVGGSLATAVIVCAELWFSARTRKQKWLFGGLMGLLTAGLFFSLSRGGWLGAMCGVVLLLLLRREFTMLIRLSVFMVPLIAVCWALLPDQSKNYATGFDKENWNIRLRYMSLDYAKSQFESSPIIGVGVGLRKEYDATNLFMLTLAETGVVGMAAFLYLHAAMAMMVWKARRYTQRNDVLFTALALGGALVLSKFIHGMVDHYWSRGALMIAWASAGMATHAYFVSRRRWLAARHHAAESHEAPEMIETAVVQPA
jgi:hypothetical protein